MLLSLQNATQELHVSLVQRTICNAFDLLQEQLQIRLGNLGELATAAGFVVILLVQVCGAVLVNVSKLVHILFDAHPLLVLLQDEGLQVLQLLRRGAAHLADVILDRAVHARLGLEGKVAEGVTLTGGRRVLVLHGVWTRTPSVLVTAVVAAGAGPALFLLDAATAAAVRGGAQLRLLQPPAPRVGSHARDARAATGGRMVVVGAWNGEKLVVWQVVLMSVAATLVVAVGCRVAAALATRRLGLLLRLLHGGTLDRREGLRGGAHSVGEVRR